MKVVVGRGMSNYHFGIKITLKLAQIIHQSIGNSLPMLLKIKRSQ